MEVQIASPGPSQQFAKRPPPGKAGRPVRLRCNFYKILSMPDLDIIQYDVVLVPDAPPSFAWKVFQHFEQQYSDKLGGLRPVYDGRKALYSPRRLPGIGAEPVKFKVEVKEDDDRVREFNLTLKEVSTITMAVIKERMRAGESVALQALDTVVRMTPSLKFSAFGRSFYTPDRSASLGGGVRLWNGYYQSVRTSMQGLILNLDVSATGYHESGPVLQILLDVLNRRDTNEFTRGISQQDIAKAEKFFKGVKVKINYRGAMRRSYRVLGLTKSDTTSSRFHHEEWNKDVSVAEYFDRQYNVRLKYPRLPCFRVGNPARQTMIPMEVCEIIPGQRFPRRLNELQTAGMVKATAVRPGDRFNTIQNGRGLLAYERDPYATNFGLNVGGQMMEVQGRVLPLPTLEYHPSSREKTLQPRGGGWNLRDKKIPDGKRLNSWAVVVFGNEREFRRENIERFVSEFCRSAGNTGMQVQNSRPPIIYGSPFEGIESTLKKAFNEAGNAVQAQPQIIMCVLPNTGTALYAEIKRVGETVIGIATQCVQGKHTRNPNPQYCANVTLKINAKLGGTNVRIQGGMPFVSERPTMVVGCDVTHPEPGDKNKPSICAVVASKDMHASQYNSLVRIQKARQEIVGALQELMMEHFKNFYIATGGHKPERLIFFRDGVSQGQFEEVCFTELKAILKAWKQLEKEKELKVTFIVVQKRHHARFMPSDPREGDKNGNVQPGTVIEEGITSSNDWDFYLNSHGALQGTSKPAHYWVLYDDNNFSNDALQRFIYSFCHTFCRATRTVSIVPPAYYADLLAYRARFHSRGGWQESSATERSDQAPLSFSRVRENLERSMYFV